VAEPGVECIIGVLTALIASCCYVPLDIEIPEDQLWFIIEDAGMKSILVTKGLETKARGVVAKSHATCRSFQHRWQEKKGKSCQFQRPASLDNLSI
jgi:non-ribosomal peptide synthetase component F